MRVLLVVLAAMTAACGGAKTPGAPERPNPVVPVATAPAPPETDPFATQVIPPGPPSPPPAHRSAIETLGITPPVSPWETMSKDDRQLYMIGKVLPIMQETFAAHDARKFAELECETCHGRDMRDRDFMMPSPSAFPVPPPGTPAFARLEQRQPEMVRFMRNTVVPTMGRLVGNDAYTCAHCHPTAHP